MDPGMTQKNPLGALRRCHRAATLMFRLFEVPDQAAAKGN
jgi:hypothetical protein